MFSRLFGKKEFGRHGEDLAVRHLAGQGYRILERNFRVASGELDIVAMDGRTLVFVEVKSRSSDAFGSPYEAVDAKKRLRMEKAAMHYIQKNNLDGAPCRFDVVGITAGDGSGPRIEVVKDAFELSGGY